MRAGLYTLSFRLDAFNDTASSVTVTNVMTGFAGLDVPVNLEIFMETNTPVLKLTGAPNHIYLLQSSTNLAEWTPAALLVNTNGTVSYAETDAVHQGARFFKAEVYAP